MAAVYCAASADSLRAMPDIDAMVILQGATNRPDDRFINTLHFSSSTIAQSWSDFADEIGDDLVDLWKALDIYPTQGEGALTGAVEVRLYNPADAKPREPKIYTGTATWSSGPAGPGEVALCLSFRGARNLPRHRGRIFLGPLRNGYTGAYRPISDLQDQLVTLAQGLSDLGSPAVDWQVVSRVGGTRERVQHVWIDNEWDTQRRRGALPTTRRDVDVSG